MVAIEAVGPVEFIDIPPADTHSPAPIVHARLRARTPGVLSARRIAISVLLGALGAGILLGLVLVNLHQDHAPLVSVIQPGTAGPAAGVIRGDFAGTQIPAAAGHDGRFFYVVARNPLHLATDARLLDYPRYRLQRIGYPVLVWLLHPQGGGIGLVRAMLAVNVAAAVLAVAALAMWAYMSGRRPAWGLLALALPGAYVNMRVSCSGLLADGLAVLAVVLFVRAGRRWRIAIAIAVAAALTRETTLLTIVGGAAAMLPTRPKDAVQFAAPAVAISGVWWFMLLRSFPHSATKPSFSPPLVGLFNAVHYWVAAGQWGPELVALGTILLAVFAIYRAPRSPFAVATAGYLALLAVQLPGTFAGSVSGPRTMFPIGFCAIAALLDRRLIVVRTEPARSRFSSATPASVPA